MHLLLSIFIFLHTGGDCGQSGSSRSIKHQQTDMLKNRTTISKSKPINIKLSNLFTGKDDEDQFSNKNWGAVTGFIVLVKKGGAETCNCHSKQDSMQDWHIEISETNTLPFDKTKIIVCEITRYSRESVGITYKQLRKLKGRKVKITGWMFFDKEHSDNAYNTNPEGTDVWRGTCWEIHPVMQPIKIIE